jgi:peptidoglycan/LPS O-acetylase OafA/YrhL
MLFHFSPQLLPGGFAGVDVFFVISGFLMTKIIFTSLQDNSFSLIQFYMTRANRIIPPLAILCLAIIIFGWFFLTPNDYKTLGKHVTSSIGFLSNYQYLKESGYFDSSSYNKWLLHTWSLSAEWQFYIIYPLFLIPLKKLFSLHAIKKCMLALTVISFCYSVVATYLWPDSSYYLLPARAWEMMLGGVAFLYPWKLVNTKRKLLEITGLLLITISYFFISKDSPWPGYLALLPVSGAFFIIQAQQTNSLITNNLVFQVIGKWSYSIYLWHWPLVVLGHYFDFPNIWALFGIPLSILCGYLSYRYIETINMKIKDFKLTSIIKYKPLFFYLIILILGRIVYKTDGIDSHYSQEVINIAAESNNRNPRLGECHSGDLDKPACVYGSGKVGVIVLGDSHAGSIVNNISKTAPKGGSTLDWTKSGCRTIEGIYNIRNKGIPDYTCDEFIKNRLKKLPEYNDIPVVIVNRYSGLLYGDNALDLSNGNGYADELIINSTINKRGDAYTKIMLDNMYNTVCKISKNNPVYMLEAIPEVRQDVPNAMAKALLTGKKDFRVQITTDYYDTRNQKIIEMQSKLINDCNVKIIQTKKYFCDEKFCYGDKNGRPLYFDDDHLSEFGSAQLIPEFRKIWNNPL